MEGSGNKLRQQQLLDWLRSCGDAERERFILASQQLIAQELRAGHVKFARKLLGLVDEAKRMRQPLKK